MKTRLLPAVCAAAAVFCVLAGALLAAPLESIPLGSGWQFRQVNAAPGAPASRWQDAEVPGDVHLDLLRLHLIPDPFYRDDESKLQWIEKSDWEYRAIVKATPALLARRNIDVVFSGLDTYCDVYLNGRKVLTADNMFRCWRVHAKPYLHPGDNDLTIVFPAPAKPAAAAAARDPWRARIGIEDKTYVRKAAYEYGWDWGPRFVTSGIWRPARIEAWDEARISNLFIEQRDITPAVARVTARVEVRAAAAADAEVVVRYVRGGKPVEKSRIMRLHEGVNRVDIPIEIEKPALWYPNGYGAQALTTFRAFVRVGNTLVDERSARVGLRSVVLRREPDKWGRSFEFVVNGIPVFAKGANVIPFDSFPSRVTKEDYRRVLESAREAHMNMIRLWGGGYYETQEFYALCDQLGIMVWQDFMFGNDWQPGTYAQKRNVGREVRDQVRRLRNHPCIVLWCGNNETESAFDWAIKRRTIDPEAQIQMWKDYLTLFYGVVGQTVRELDPEVPYWSSSPTSDFEATSAAYASGDTHDWNVWHGGAPFDEYTTQKKRFFSEFGFQSFPDLKTVEEFTAPGDRTSIFTPVMLAHQKNTAGNSIIEDYMLKYYGQPKDFASFLYASQVLQAEGIKVGAESMRRNRPCTMGSLYWQLNDCWPVASWSSIDYYGRWKALQYYARRFYAPLLVSPTVENGAVAVYIVSDRTAAVGGTLRLRVMDFSGKVLEEQTVPVTVPALSSKVYLSASLGSLAAKVPDFRKAFVSTTLAVGERTVSSNVLYLVPTREIQLPEARIAADWAREEGGYRLRLTSPVLARSVRVSFASVEASVSDNYFDLLPGEPVAIEVKSSADPEQLKAALRIVSLVDAFVPVAGKP